jgi:hypothetical protein
MPFATAGMVLHGHNVQAALVRSHRPNWQIASPTCMYPGLHFNTHACPLAMFAQFVAYVPYDPITDTGAVVHGIGLQTEPTVLNFPLVHVAFIAGMYPVLQRSVHDWPLGVDTQLSNAPFAGFGVGADAQFVAAGCVHEPGLHIPCTHSESRTNVYPLLQVTAHDDPDVTVPLHVADTPLLMPVGDPVHPMGLHVVPIDHLPSWHTAGPVGVNPLSHVALHIPALATGAVQLHLPFGIELG